MLPGFVFTALISLASVASAASLNDISVLLPLPSPDERVLMLKPDERNLIPKDLYDELPTLVMGADPNEIYEHALKAVGIRLDPCFFEGGGPRKCRRQIRLVWQPVIEFRGRLTTHDAALHSFHEFDEKTWQELVRSWRRFSSGRETDALDVHPVIREQGYQGEAWKTLRSLVLQFCGPRNLVRITSMTVNPVGTLWVFSGLDRIGESWVPIEIPGLKKKTQAFQLDLENLREFRSAMSPRPADSAFLRVILDSQRARETLTEPQIRDAFADAFAIENPNLHNPGTRDCVSCHLAQVVRLWGERNYKNWSWPDLFPEFRFQSSRPLGNNSVSPFATNRLRAFGYFADEPIFSQRVVNETALAFDALQ